MAIDVVRIGHKKKQSTAMTMPNILGLNNSGGGTGEEEDDEPFLVKKLFPKQHNMGEGIQSYNTIGELDLVTEIPRRQIAYLIGLDLISACFPAGVRVVTHINKYGLSKTKKIETIREGDYVLSYNESTGQVETEEVTKKIVILHKSDFVRIDILKRKSINCTPEHPIYVDGQGYIAAKEVKSGDKVLRFDKTFAEVIANNEYKDYAFPNVYNLEVDGNHNYFASGILVHNCMDENRTENLADVAQRSLKKNMVSVSRKGRVDLIDSAKSELIANREEPMRF